MPKIIKFDRDKFVDAYQARKSCGRYFYTIKRLTKLFKIKSQQTTTTYANKFGLSRNKRRNNND